MTATISRFSLRDQDSEKVELYELMSAVGSTSAIRLQGDVIVQLSGTATNIVAKLEHATRDPGGAEANWAPADDDGFSGNLSAGMSPRPYRDPAAGYWRVTITTLTGGTCKVSIIGEAG